MMTSQIEAMLKECAREPIRFPGKIQPHGALLVVDKNDLRILCASENVGQFLGLQASTLITQTLRDAFDLSDELERCLREESLQRARLFALPRKDLVVRVTVTGAHALLEFQPAPRPRSVDFLYCATAALSGIHSAADASTAIELAVAEVQRLVGCDRVMMYRFDGQWNGQVVAERVTPGTLPLLGQYYPASDIPEQARALYAQNWLRFIPEVDYVPVELRALDGSFVSGLDLGAAVLRSVSPIHVEYLKAMGVSASLSISVLCGGALWGLIACHHSEPWSVCFDVLERCELVGCVLSAKLETEQAREHARARNQAISTVASLTERMRKSEDLAEALVQAQAELLGLVQASGAAILHRGALRVVGETPSEAQLQRLTAWLASQGSTELATTALHEQHAEAREYATQAAGMLCMSLPDTESAYLMWFRPELVRVVSWGGNPDKPCDVLGPRRSFELWKQTVQLSSLPWSDADREAAAELRRGVIETELQKQLRREQKQRRALERSNRELDAYAQVIAHDLLAPVRGIVAFASRMRRDLTEGKHEQAADRAQTVGRAALALADLVQSLHQYSRAGQVELAIEDTDLTALVELEAQRLAPFLSENGAQVDIAAGLPTVRCDRVRVGAVLGNLISNAVKYNVSAPKIIRILSRDSVPPTICVADNGIGIAPGDRELVLRSFKRLHSRDAYGGGVGMGLSIAQRIVERHGGRMWIEDTPGGGTTVAFTLAPDQAD